VLVTVGVPLTTPAVEKLRPVGSTGNTLYVSVPVPPVPVTGVNAVDAWLSVSVVLETDVVAETGPLTVRLNVAVAVAAFISVTVTVYAVRGLVTVGVPLIAPVAAILSPEGRTGSTL